MRKIETEAQYQQALKKIDKLIIKVGDNHSYDNPVFVMMDKLSDLVADYEDQHYEINAPSLIDVIKLRMYEIMSSFKLFNLKFIIPILFSLVVFTGCSEKYDRVPADQFVGTWELKGRKMFEGIQIVITKENNKLTGKISKLNDNKYVLLFAEVNDVWVSDISRSSNFRFRLTEKKIGRELFSLYGLSSSAEYKVEFIDKNTIGLTSGSADPTESTVVYKRIE